jgi:hypothetical protein
MTYQWYNNAAFFTQKGNLLEFGALILVNSEQTDELQRQLQNLKRDMDDLRSRLSVEQDEYDRAEHEKHRAEELVVRPHPAPDMLTTGHNHDEKEALQPNHSESRKSARNGRND